MDDRLITVVALVAALVLALGVTVFFAVRSRNDKRDRDGAVEEAARERQGRHEAERRAVALQEHVEKILQGTPYRAPRKLWSAKGFGLLAGLVTGAWAAAKTFLASVTSNTAAGSAAASTGSAVTGGVQSLALSSAFVLVAGAGAMAAYPEPAPASPLHHPPGAVGATHPPAKQWIIAGPPSSVLTTPSTTTPTLTPTVTSTETPTKTPPTTARSKHEPAATPTTTATAAPSDSTPSATVTATAAPTAAPADAAPKAVDDTKTIRPIPDTPASQSAQSSKPTSRTCVELGVALICAG